RRIADALLPRGRAQVLPAARMAHGGIPLEPRRSASPAARDEARVVVAIHGQDLERRAARGAADDLGRGAARARGDAGPLVVHALDALGFLEEGRRQLEREAAAAARPI